MTYASLLEIEGINSQYLVIMKPRAEISSAWSLVSGNIYSTTFSLGEVVSVTVDGTALTAHTSASVGSNQYYYDPDTSLLYVNIGASPATNQVVATYELYFGTFDAHWYRIPTDNTTRVVYYEPLIIRSPQITNSASDILSGFLPTFSAQVGISNATQYLQEHIYASSFNLADILIYHWLDELSTANVKLVLKGYCREISSSDSDVSFSILDATSFFEKQYRNPTGLNFYATSIYANLDPQFQGRPVRQVFGVVDGFVPVNIDYVADNGSVTSSDNKRYICISEDTNPGTVSTTVKASPSSTTTRTYLTSVDGFRVGDTWWNKTVTSKYGEITAVGADYIDHTAIGVANASTNVIERSFVGAVWVARNQDIYKLWYGRDYVEYTDTTNKTLGFDINTAIGQADLATDDLIYANDLIYARVYGHKISETIGGSPFGSNSAVTGNKTNGVFLLYHLLKTCLGLSESDIDTTAFSTLNSSITDNLGFAVPEGSRNDFPSYKNLIIDICQSILLKLYLDTDLKWSISQTGPLGAEDKTIEDDEILLSSFDYNISYTDIISRILLRYAKREISELAQPQDSFSVVNQTSDTATNLHLVDNQKTFTSLHFVESEAQTLCDRLSFHFGDRQGTCRISTKNRFFDTELGDVIDVTRARLPGYAYDQNTDRTRSFAVNSTQKSLSKIDIELNDLKGIQDNEGDW